MTCRARVARGFRTCVVGGFRVRLRRGFRPRETRVLQRVRSPSGPTPGSREGARELVRTGL
ncbi:hypothetical protein LV78_004342 [Actinosynnema pretiosum]|nr:hypothetical protein [Actinosynnema pretiosum]